ncbi:T9SS type A sorting domain-containing protein [bacterium]|nr:T9SS type A sorting domain-containing protein [bacterium]
MNCRLFPKNATFFAIVMIILAIQFNPMRASANSIYLPVEDGANEAAPEVYLIEEAADHLIISIDISGVFVRNIHRKTAVRRPRLTEKNELYHKLLFEDGRTSSSSLPGEPYLPYITEIIRIPDNSSASVSVVSVEWSERSKLNLYPRQHPRRDDSSPRPEFIKSDKAYQAAGPVPENIVTIGGIHGWGGVAVSPLSVTPFRYYPSEQGLEIAKKIVLRVDFAPGHRQNIIKSSHPSRKLREIQQVGILNPPPEIPREMDFDENEPVRMLAVMKEEALENAQPLIDFHHNSGIRTEVWLVDDVEDEHEIKDRVREMFEEGLEYLFIIGDGCYYENETDVPMHLWGYPNIDPGWQDDESTTSHSDTWYVCLDPRNDDGYEDHVPDLTVGRITYDAEENMDELELQVNKLLDYIEWRYEDNDGEWLSRAGLMAYRDVGGDEGTEYIECKQAIAEFEYQYPTPEFFPFYGNEENATNANVIRLINEEGIGILNYRGHGNSSSWPSWSFSRETWNRTQVNRLENIASPFILISSACLTGNIATRRSDCLVESFLKHDEGGSISAQGSVITTYTPGNHFFDRRIFSTWFEDGIYDVGYAYMDALAEMVLNWENDWYSCTGRMNARASIWLGDPAFELKMAPPQEMAVEISEFIPSGTQQLEATFTMNDEPLTDARICVRGGDEDEVYVVAVSDEEGRALLEFDPPLDDILHYYWTAYHRNAFTVEGEILISGSATIEGRVIELESEQPFEGVTIDLSIYGIDLVTDNEGSYHFENMPSGFYIVTAGTEDYISESAEVNVEDDGSYVVDFAMTYSRLEADSMIVNMRLEEGQSEERGFIITNTGNGLLEWSASLQFSAGPNPFQMIGEYYAQQEIGDRHLNGVEYIDGVFYIAGANNNGDPNYIYMIDSLGNYIDHFEQSEESSGIGYFDLAYDGTYLYGSSNEHIFQFDLEGNVTDRINGPYNPNMALTCDGEGNLWVGLNTEDLIKIDSEGNILNRIPNFRGVRALAWNPDALDNNNLLLLVREEDRNTASLYSADIVSGDVRYDADLTVDEDDDAASGFSVSETINPGTLTLIGTISNFGERVIRLWHLDTYTGWLTLENDAGFVFPDEDDTIALTFFGFELGDGLRLEAEVLIENNSAEPVITVPVVFEIGAQDVIPDEHVQLPLEFSVGSPYPNPFNARTVIPIDLPIGGELTVVIYDLTGRLIVELASGRYDAGRHTINFAAENLPSGVYLVNIKYFGNNITRKIVLMR